MEKKRGKTKQFFAKDGRSQSDLPSKFKHLKIREKNNGRDK